MRMNGAAVSEGLGDLVNLDGLSPGSRRLYDALAPRRARSLGRKLLMVAALREHDLAEELRGARLAEGLTQTTAKTRMIHLSPLARAEMEARVSFVRAWTALGMAWDADIDSRIER